MTERVHIQIRVPEEKPRPVRIEPRLVLADLDDESEVRRVVAAVHEYGKVVLASDALRVLLADPPAAPETMLPIKVMLRPGRPAPLDDGPLLQPNSRRDRRARKALARRRPIVP